MVGCRRGAQESCQPPPAPKLAEHFPGPAVAPPDPAVLVPSGDGGDLQQRGVGGSHGHSHDGHRSADLDAGGLLPKPQSPQPCCLPRRFSQPRPSPLRQSCKLQHRRDPRHLICFPCWGSQQPPLCSHCHPCGAGRAAGGARGGCARSVHFLPGQGTLPWEAMATPKEEDWQLPGLSSQQEASTTSLTLQGASGDGHTGTGPSAGSCASPQGLPAPPSIYPNKISA